MSKQGHEINLRNKAALLAVIAAMGTLAERGFEADSAQAQAPVPSLAANSPVQELGFQPRFAVSEVNGAASSRFTATAVGKITMKNVLSADTPADGATQEGPQTVDIRVVNQAGVPAEQLQAFEIAATKQARQLRHYWGSPLIRFSDKKGWPLKLESATNNPDLSGNGVGYHSYENGHPVMVAAVGASAKTSSTHSESRVKFIPWTKIASHELLEALVDPTCDKVINSYAEEDADGARLVKDVMRVRLPDGKVTYVSMADANTPAFFTGAPGPKDLKRKIRASASQPGGFKYGYGVKVGKNSTQTVGKIHTLGYDD